MKVKALAQELRRPTKELIAFLMSVDIKVNSGNTKLDDETVQAVRELLAGGPKKGEDAPSVVKLKKEEPLKVNELVQRFKVKLSDVMKFLLQKGLTLSVNSEVDFPTVLEIAAALEVPFEVEGVTKEEKSAIKHQLNLIEEAELSNPDTLQTRSPVITIMGHVDHGKTKLLDTIRTANVMDSEAGGITQHIGAYQVEVRGRKLTFLDTPGHEAFTALRARGAQVTDIAIIVVAADESVKPQTIEAIHHAKAANVAIMVAINKIDKPDANLDRCKQDLATEGLVAEDWGGTTIMVPVSAKSGKGIEDLLGMILLVADTLELKASFEGDSRGVIIESHLSKTLGPVATILVKSGTLRVGDYFVVGSAMGKARALLNDHSVRITEALPSMPVMVTGFEVVPAPGDILSVYATEKEAKAAAQSVLDSQTEDVRGNNRTISFQSLSQQIGAGQIKTLNLIVRSDVHGSLEAIIASVGQIPSDEVQVQILHAATGPITESDVTLAQASSAIIIAFNVPVSGDVQKMAQHVGVQIKEYRIIYEIVDDIRKVLEGMFRVEFEEVEEGTAEVRQLFSFSKVGKIAGCHVSSGRIIRNGKIRVFRGKELIHEGELETLKRFKEDVREVQAGFECGIVLAKFDAFQPGDVVQCYTLREKSR